MKGIETGNIFPSFRG